jgi:hypothetical protein
MPTVVPDPESNALSQCPPLDPTTEISGGVLPDGRTVDLIRDGSNGKLKLLVFDGTRTEAASSVRVEGRTFLPVTLDPDIQRAVTLPSHAFDYGSTESLFSATHEVLTRHGMSEEIANAACYFVFGTWFPERSLPAPCLVITGPTLEAILLFQLLGCLVRRGLHMVEIDSSGFRSVVGLLRPTLLIDGRHLGRRSLRLLSVCGPRAYVPWKESVVDLGLAKAIYLGAAPLADFSADFSVHLHILPSLANVSMLDEKTREQIIADFQPKFLDYRLRNFAAVGDSVFDLPGIDSEGRVIARILGTCIVDSPEIQAGIRHLLQHRDVELRTERWTDLTCVVIEVLLAQCHNQSPRDESNGHPGTGIHVNEIAKKAEVVLKGRGAPTELEPRAIGGILNRLKLYRTRDARGRRIVLSPEVRRRIHVLARNYQVESVRDGDARCDLCKEVFEKATGE